MKTRNRKLQSMCFSYRLSGFLAFYFLVSTACAQVSSEQLDPINILMSRLTRTSEDVNAPSTVGAISTIKSIWEPTYAAISVNLASRIGRELPQGSLDSTPKSSSQLKRQLWQDRITAPESREDKRGRNELQQIIEQIRSVGFEPQNEPPEPVIVVEQAPAARPDETSSRIEAKEAPGKKEVESGQELVSGRTLQMLESLLQHPDQIDNPLELAEVLFISGYLKEAGVFYQDALNRKSADEAGSAQETTALRESRDRTWTMFQIGNCLRDRDLPAAKKMYQQLIAEYPGSPWTDLARAQDKLIDWYQTNEPYTLVKSEKTR